VSNLAFKYGPVTIAEFDAFLETRSDDWDLFDLIAGQIVMMTNPTNRHECIVANIGARLKLAMDRRACRTYIGGTRLQAGHDKGSFNKPRPDIVVRCGKSDAASDRLNYVTDPVVIVEVLSPRTMDYDRGQKLEFYQSIDTLRHIVIVYQDQLRIEHYRRIDEAWGEPEALTKASKTLLLDAVEFSIPVADAYFDVTFE
jgi:Uma2 family endonuclease